MQYRELIFLFYVYKQCIYKRTSIETKDFTSNISKDYRLYTTFLHDLPLGISKRIDVLQLNNY